ncbi:MAG: DUF2911 domain-containing protein [bacterium]|nr:DUF2911 domain-containing protein [bacterium]
MKRRRQTLMLLMIALLLAGVSHAERGDDTNRKSKNGELRGPIGGVEMTLEYGRPNVKDRKIWGGLVPYDRVWRTGADEATTISFDHDVKVEGEPLPAGRYAFFTIPRMESWTLVFNNTPDQWGAFSYDDTEDALRVDVSPVSAEHVEALTFSIEGSDVVLRWEKLAVSFTVEADG